MTHSADARCKTKDGKTPVMIAVAHDHSWIVSYLVHAGGAASAPLVYVQDVNQGSKEFSEMLEDVRFQFSFHYQ